MLILFSCFTSLDTLEINFIFYFFKLTEIKSLVHNQPPVKTNSWVMVSYPLSKALSFK